MKWKSDYENKDYEPVYLANGAFGGRMDLSGSDMALWSSHIVAAPANAKESPRTLYPVTALVTKGLYRNPYWKEKGFWLGRSGILSGDPNYTADPSMPHRCQVYQCEQHLSLREGVLTTKGTLFPGAWAALAGGHGHERAIPFQTRLAFLKDATLLGMELRADEETEILFLAAPLAEEALALRSEGGGIHSLGNEIDVDFAFSQRVLEEEAAGHTITMRVQPGSEAPYRIRLHAPGASLRTVEGRPAFFGAGRLFLLLQVLPEGWEEEPETDAFTAESFFAEQRRRWETFWKKSQVALPAEEAAWQERYEAGLFYVAQSMTDGPVHPTGLSKPMLPYWYGSFHDTDTYFCRPLLETGHFTEAGAHLHFRYRTLGKAKEIARQQGRSGALYPWTADPQGDGAVHDVPVNNAIVAVEAWWQYRHAGGETRREQARAIIADVFANLWDLVDAEASPLRLRADHLMTFSETMVASDPTEVRVGIRATAACLLEAGCEDPLLRERAERVLGELSLPADPDGGYAFGQDKEPAYLRCPSVILGSFPLHHLPADTRLGKTFHKELERILLLFAWLPHQASIVASQLQLREGATSAAELLRAADGFYKPWHAYDEWENRRAVRAANFVTAAGGFCSAIHAMLLAETSPGTWSLFPGVPWSWKNVSFRNLTTRAGWRVSAEKRNGRITSFTASPVHGEAAAVFRLLVEKEETVFTNPERS